jgi:protein arginine N-methyltransferase 1
LSLNNIYVRRFTAAEVLAAKVWDTIDLTRDARSSRSGEARWPVAKAVRIVGFAAWWDTTLVPGITLSTAPDAPETHWEQLYLPLLEPLDLARGETLCLTIRSKSSYAGGTTIAWTAVVTDASGHQRTRQALDLEKGFLP